MKHLLALITCILLPLFSAWDLSGQEQTLRFPERKMKIADVFSAIEKQTDYTVAYNESVLDAGKVVTVPERKSLTEVLTAIPEGHRDTVLLSRKDNPDPEDGDSEESRHLHRQGHR